MAIALKSVGGGSVTIADPASTASNFTLNPPLRSGQLAVDGPAFSAYNSGTQTVSTATATKLTCDTKVFDTASCFDNTTNYRFTPNVAGYYQINLIGYGYPSAAGVVSMRINKNGSTYRKAEVPNSNQGPQPTCSALVYLNGSTDYVEGYAFQNSGGNLTMSATEFSGALVRAA